MFRRHQQLRRWAAHVLLLWLLGVGTAIANTCLMPNLLASGVQSAVHADDADMSPHEHTASGHAPQQDSNRAQCCDDEHGHDGPAVHSNCADFCDKASISLPPLKSVLDDVQGHAVGYPAILVIHPVPAPMPVPRKVPRRDGAWAPPIPIAFLRLAL
jgi:hypothetical protein